jgi:hypothetical protein
MLKKIKYMIIAVAFVIVSWIGYLFTSCGN